MLKLIDKIYFRLRDAVYGYQKGFDAGQAVGFSEGYDIGVQAARLVMSENLVARNPNLSDDAFKLGYAHAVAIVKGEIK